MKNAIKKLCRCLLRYLPGRMYTFAAPLFSKVLDPDEIQKIMLEAFSKRVMEHEGLLERIARNKNYMVIREGIWSSSYFNVAVANNLVGLMIYSLFRGYIPVVSINEGIEDYFHWEWYFKQPFGEIKDDAKKVINCDQKRVAYVSGWKTSVDMESREYRIWSYWFKRLLILNEETCRYVDDEAESLKIYQNTLGVLLRGTDYVSLKPKGHPVQPGIEEVIGEIKHALNTGGYEKIYLATDEKKLFDIVETSVSVPALSNKRTYYDDKYQQGLPIGTVHFDRDKDNYYKGLEYLSSMLLLSRCKGIVAGNCGGTKFACLMADKRFDHHCVFDKGVY